MAGMRPQPVLLNTSGSLLGAIDVRALAASIGLTPTKTLGQNFVIDGGTVQRIARIAALSPDDVVLEIGPGLGSLTLALLPGVRRVVAVEIDARLAALLPSTITSRAAQHAEKLSVIHRDAMGIDARDLPEQPTAIVANLPYNVAVPVLLTLLPKLPTVRRVLVMVQLEVAERLAAKPAEAAYGVPSVKAAWYGDVRMAGTVGRQVFWPAPRVDSGLVALDRREPPASSATREEVFAVVDAAFGQRRKTLRAALARWAGSPSAAEAALRAAGIDSGARGETLGVVAFARIAEQKP
jgi:16S rRNA (adenine1518-N6/adenine1519-N6)-dimethyltransferase